VVGNNFRPVNLYIEDRNFDIQIPDMRSDNEIVQVLPGIGKLYALSRDGKHLFIGKGALRQFILYYKSRRQTPSITEMLHEIYKRSVPVGDVFKTRVSIKRFVEELRKCCSLVMLRRIVRSESKSTTSTCT
jgi:hypothetical protein